MTKRKYLNVFISVILIIALSITPAYAQDVENGNIIADMNRSTDTDYHGYAGVYIAGPYRGISANITMPSTLPNVSDSGESAWVSTSATGGIMVDGELINQKWIQVGAKYYSSEVSEFVQYVEHFENGGYVKVEIDVHPLGTEEAYKVEYNSWDGKWYSYIGVEQLIGFRLPVADNDVQAHAEVHKENIQMGPFIFSQVKVKNNYMQWSNNTVAPEADSPYEAIGSATTFVVRGP